MSTPWSSVQRAEKESFLDGEYSGTRTGWSLCLLSLGLALQDAFECLEKNRPQEQEVVMKFLTREFKDAFLSRLGDELTWEREIALEETS